MPNLFAQAPKRPTLPTVDHAALALEPGFLDRYADTGELRARFGTTAGDLATALEPHFVGSPLVTVAAHYAALTLRHDYRRDPAGLSYPLFLLAAWIWDDLVDTNKGSAGAQRALREGLPRLQAAMASGRFAAVPVSFGRFRRPLRAAATMSVSVHGLTRDRLPNYRPRIEAEVVRFLASFARKATLTHRMGLGVEAYAESRATCVGMQPCYELAYALKAMARGLEPEAHLQYLGQDVVANCAQLATLHCAAVNDLFSMYKDRCLEDTANFPSVLGSAEGLAGYFLGAERTIDYVRRLYAEFRASRDLLPEGRSREVVIETWEHMMEGNLLFHLLVPRYREGVGLLRDLLHPGLSGSERLQRFEGAFVAVGGQHTIPSSAAPGRPKSPAA